MAVPEQATQVISIFPLVDVIELTEVTVPVQVKPEQAFKFVMSVVFVVVCVCRELRQVVTVVKQVLRVFTQLSIKL